VVIGEKAGLDVDPRRVACERQYATRVGTGGFRRIKRRYLRVNAGAKRTAIFHPP